MDTYDYIGNNLFAIIALVISFSTAGVTFAVTWTLVKYRVTQLEEKVKNFIKETKEEHNNINEKIERDIGRLEAKVDKNYEGQKEGNERIARVEQKIDTAIDLLKTSLKLESP